MVKAIMSVRGDIASGSSPMALIRHAVSAVMAGFGGSRPRRITARRNPDLRLVLRYPVSRVSRDDGWMADLHRVTGGRGT